MARPKVFEEYCRSFSPEEQQRDILAIKQRQIQREKDAAIINAQDKIEEKVFKQAEIYDERNVVETQILSAQKQIRELREKELELLKKRQLAQDFLRDADENRDSKFLGFRAHKFTAAAERQEASALKVFGPDRQQQLSSVQSNLSTLLPLVDQLEDQYARLSQSLDSTEIAANVARESAQIVAQQAEVSADLKTQTLEAREGARKVEAASMKLSADISGLQALSENASQKSESDRELIKGSQEQMRKILADGQLTQQELAQTIQVLATTSRLSANSSKDVSRQVGDLQSSVQQLQSALIQVKTENIKIREVMKQISGR